MRTDKQYLASWGAMHQFKTNLIKMSLWDKLRACVLLRDQLDRYICVLEKKFQREEEL